MHTIGVKQLAEFVYKMQEPPTVGREGYDALVAITGKTGVGKSDLSLSLGVELAKMRRKRFKPKDSLIWTRAKLNEELQEGEPKTTYIVDEAIKVLFSKDAQRSIDLTKTLNICRSKNYAVILNIPALSDMERSIRDNRLRFMVWIRKRGEAYLFKPDNKPQLNARQADPWNSNILKKYQESSEYWRHPNCVAKIVFGPVDERVREEYLDLKERYAYEALTDDDPRREKSGRLNTLEYFIAYLQETGNYSRFRGISAEAARYLGLDQSTLHNRVSKIEDAESSPLDGENVELERKKATNSPSQEAWLQ